MKKLTIAGLLVLTFGLPVLFMMNGQQSIVISDAVAVKMPGQDNVFMVSLSIRNDGAPETLKSARSPSAVAVHLMNPGYPSAALVIPKDGTAILGADGAHLTLTPKDDTFEDGTFMPLILTFEHSGDVSTRVQNVATGGMSHAQTGIEEELKSSVSVSVIDGISAAGVRIALTLQNFTMSRHPDETSHKSGEGHGHVYLNGLKLGRIYETEYEIGALAPGMYELRVALNSNDHRPYLSNGEPVSSTISFEIPG